MYEAERAFAVDFLDRLRQSQPVQGEVAEALRETLSRYDTGIRENRFTVGGVIEQIIGSSARALSLDIDNAGVRAQGYDLELRPGSGLSIKFKSGPIRTTSTVRLTNTQGAMGVWDNGTIFVLSGVGIGYADDELTPGITFAAGDGKSLDIAVLPLLTFWGCAPPPGGVPRRDAARTVFAPDPRYYVDAVVPDRPAVRSERLASEAVARDIFSSGRTPMLRAAYRDAV